MVLEAIMKLIRRMAALVEIQIIWTYTSTLAETIHERELRDCKTKVLHDLGRLLKANGLANLKKFRIVPELKLPIASSAAS